MTDLHVITIVANDGDIQERVAACAASKGEPDPIGFASQHRWKVAAHGQIADVYEYTEASKTINDNPRSGQRTDAVRDDMIEAAVEDIITERDAPAPVTEPTE